MKKILVQCWTKDITCLCGQKKITHIYKSVSDFYEGFGLFICPCCKELFALDLEKFKYLRKTLEEILQNKACPNCKTSFEKLLNYPEQYACFHCKNLQITDDIERRIHIHGPVEAVQFYDLFS